MKSNERYSDIGIYIVDDDQDVRDNTKDLLSTQFSNISTFDSPKKIIDKITPSLPAIILTDLRMPDADGFQYALKMLEVDSDLPVILMTGYGEVSIAVDAMRHGIYDFIEKPFDVNRLFDALNRAVEKRYLTLCLQKAQKQLSDLSDIEHRVLGHSTVIKQLRQDILDLSPLEVPVMVYGETGSGKELAARCLHDYSKRRDAPFVAINCAAIPEQLAEAELFGNTKGAFTDAKDSRVGKLEYAHGGTIFLDEIESLPLSVQAKLLRALSDNKITPLGSNRETPIDCRIISGSKIDLKNNNEFRQDLFFRLAVAAVHIPPLRDREEDIITLFEFFSMQNCKKLGTTYQSTTMSVRERLINHTWPGNVRELVNASTRFAIKHCADIDYALESKDILVAPVSEKRSLKEQVEHYEASLIKLKLREHQGKVSKVLEDLSLERRTFNQKLNRYGINTSSYKVKS